MSDKLQMQSVRGFLTANSLQRLNCYREGCLCGESRAFSRDKIINAQLQILLSLLLNLRPYWLGYNQAQLRMQHHIFFWRQLEKAILIPCKLSGDRKCAGHSDPKAQWPFPSLLPNQAKKLDSLISSYYQCMFGAVIFNYFINHQVSLSAWAARTKYHRLCGLDNRHLFFIVPKARDPKVKVLADSVPGESSFPGLQRAIFTLYAPMAFHQYMCREKKEGRKGGRDGRRREVGWGEGERKRDREVSAFFMREGPTLMTSTKLITSQRSHLQIPSHQAFGASTYKFWGDINIQSVTPTVLGTCSNLSESPSISIALHALWIIFHHQKSLTNKKEHVLWMRKEAHGV